MPTIINSVVDLSHHNGTVDLAAAKADGLLGVIQKATQGETFVDPTFATNGAAAAKNGLLLGAYHFGTGANGVSQAVHFLETVKPTKKTVVVLDFEDNHAGTSMTLEEARAFVVHVQSKLGRFPGFYSGHTIKAKLGTTIDPILSKCWFWLAQYGPTPVVPPCWSKWTMWQYTDGAVGPRPHEVEGIGRCDRDKFNGSAKDLATFWGT